MYNKCIHIILFILAAIPCMAQSDALKSYHPIWTSQSENAAGSMPCGGGDIGLNVWVENNELLFYMAQSGCFDEHNTALKAGRIRIQFDPVPFSLQNFTQELCLSDGSLIISGKNLNTSVQIRLWVDVYHPIVHVEITSNTPIHTTATYENWRYQDKLIRKGEGNQMSYKWAVPDSLMALNDEVSFFRNGVLFYHRNQSLTVFDVTVKQQGMSTVADQMFDPLKNLTSGGFMRGPGMIPDGTTEGDYMNNPFKGWRLISKNASRQHHIAICLTNKQSSTLNEWHSELESLIDLSQQELPQARKRSMAWWKQYWERSFIFIHTNRDSTSWQIARNYQLFRYMLGCNAYGSYPTKFNGGLFTVDPVVIDPLYPFSPDFRKWGGGTFTAQNQRLVYWPMLRAGDFDLMKSQFDFYLRLLKNAELRSQIYWQHQGACFTEQIENFGLPNCTEYGWNRPEGFDQGLEYNAWLEYQWDNVLEFCLMMLEQHRYTQKDIHEYLPFVKSCLTFFDEHYQYLAKQRGRKVLDENGHLVIYPGSACETYKMAYNATSTIAGLKTVLNALLSLPDSLLPDNEKTHWNKILSRIPPIHLRSIQSNTVIAPARLWERVNNTESPQLYPVFPWSVYGIGKPDLQIALNTYLYDQDVQKFKSHIGWKQHNIWAARLGLTDEASLLTQKKLGNSGRRFPAFWGPGFDWTPDFNHGGSGMIGLQEMLMQTSDDKIYLFPAWPKNWDVHFKLWAPQNTQVEASLVNGIVKLIKVTPESRRKDIEVLIKTQP